MGHQLHQPMHGRLATHIIQQGLCIIACAMLEFWFLVHPLASIHARMHSLLPRAGAPDVLMWRKPLGGESTCSALVLLAAIRGIRVRSCCFCTQQALGSSQALGVLKAIRKRASYGRLIEHLLTEQTELVSTPSSYTFM